MPGENSSSTCTAMRTCENSADSAGTRPIGSLCPKQLRVIKANALTKANALRHAPARTLQTRWRLCPSCPPAWGRRGRSSGQGQVAKTGGFRRGSGGAVHGSQVPATADSAQPTAVPPLGALEKFELPPHLTRSQSRSQSPGTNLVGYGGQGHALVLDLKTFLGLNVLQEANFQRESEKSRTEGGGSSRAPGRLQAAGHAQHAVQQAMAHGLLPCAVHPLALCSTCVVQALLSRRCAQPALRCPPTWCRPSLQRRPGMVRPVNSSTMMICIYMGGGVQKPGGSEARLRGTLGPERPSSWHLGHRRIQHRQFAQPPPDSARSYQTSTTL